MTRRELSVSLVTKLRNKAFRRELKEESNRQGDELDLIITSVLEGKKTKKKSEQREAEKNVQEAIQEKKGEGKRGWKDYLSFGEDQILRSVVVMFKEWKEGWTGGRKWVMEQVRKF